MHPFLIETILFYAIILLIENRVGDQIVSYWTIQ